MATIPSIASLGVLNPKPMLFQYRFPPFPGLLPLPDFFELQIFRADTYSQVHPTIEKLIN